MDQFFIYLYMGFDHISDIKGFDHMLFLITLCAVYKISDWKKVAVLVTAFTIGHSVTLALSALKVIIANANLIEILIPITILCTSIHNIYNREISNQKIWSINYLLALIFGFVHGLGFSNYFNILMGDSMNIIWPLFAFNIGLELGQLIIVLVFFCLYFLITKVKNIEQRNWNMFFSYAGVIISLIMIINRIY